MKKKIRLALLVLAGALSYMASERAGTAIECEPQCWDNWGQICCIRYDCIDFCW